MYFLKGTKSGPMYNVIGKLLTIILAKCSDRKFKKRKKEKEKHQKQDE